MSLLGKGQTTIITVENSVANALKLVPNQSISPEYTSDTDTYYPDYSSSSLFIEPSLLEGSLDTVDYEINGKTYSEIDGVTMSGNNLVISKNIGDIDLGVDSGNMTLEYAQLESELQPLFTGSDTVDSGALTATYEYNDAKHELFNEIVESKEGYIGSGENLCASADATTPFSEWYDSDRKNLASFKDISDADKIKLRGNKFTIGFSYEAQDLNIGTEFFGFAFDVFYTDDTYTYVFVYVRTTDIDYQENVLVRKTSTVQLADKEIASINSYQPYFYGANITSGTLKMGHAAFWIGDTDFDWVLSSEDSSMDLSSITTAISDGELSSTEIATINTEVTKQAGLEDYFTEKASEFSFDSSYYEANLASIVALNTLAQSATAPFTIDTEEWTNAFTNFNRSKLRLQQAIEDANVGNYSEGFNLYSTRDFYDDMIAYSNATTSDTSIEVTDEGEVLTYVVGDAYRYDNYASGIFEENTAYTFSLDCKGDGYASAGVVITFSDDTLISSLRQTDAEWVPKSITTDASKSISYINIYHNVSASVQIRNLRIYKGTQDLGDNFSPRALYQNSDTAESVIASSVANDSISETEQATIISLWEVMASHYTGLVDMAQVYENILNITASTIYNSTFLQADISVVLTQDVGGAPETFILTPDGIHLTKHNQTTELKAEMYKGGHIQTNVTYTWLKEASSGALTIVSREASYTVSAVNTSEKIRRYICRTVNSKGLASEDKAGVTLKLTGYEPRISASVSETPTSAVSSQTLTCNVYHNGERLTGDDIATIQYQWYKVGEGNVETKLTGKTARTLTISGADAVGNYSVEIYN